MKTSRIILHIDMNAFFAACEIANNESLRGKPIVIAHNDNYDRGLIVSPSYEARKLGIKTTMYVKEARKLCRNLIVVEPTRGLYTMYSNKFYEYLLTITPNVEMASIDEAYVDITSLNLGKNSIDLCKKIQDDLLNLYKLPCSIGLAPNKLLAKMGSDYKKPLGITIIRKRDVPTLIWPLSISDMLFIGKKTAPKLEEIGIKTIGDLANFQNITLLEEKFGTNFVKSMIPKCFGNDDSEVITTSSTQTSASAAHTFMDEVVDETLLIQTIKSLVNTISYRLEKDNLKACNIGIMVKYVNYSYFNKSTKLEIPTNSSYKLFNQVKTIFDDNYDNRLGVRYISIHSSRLTETKETNIQLSIFDDLSEIEKSENVNKLMQEINNQIGKTIIKKGM